VLLKLVIFKLPTFDLVLVFG